MPAASPKVLRVAVVRDGRVLTERLLHSDEPLTVGSASSNAIVIADSSFGQATTLMTVSDLGYDLHPPGEMRGKLTVHSQPQTVVGPATLCLNRTDRGKLVLHDVTVLFQFVTPPVHSIRPLNPPFDFRPQLMEEEDPMFIGAVGILTVMAAMLLGFAYVSPAPAHAAVIGIEQRIVQRMARVPVVMAPEESPAEEPAPVEEPESTANPSPSPNGGPRSSPDAEQPDGEHSGEEPASLWITMMGSTGPDASTEFGRITGEIDDRAGELDEALQQVGGVAIAQAGDAPRTVEGVGGQGGDVDIGDLDRVRTGPVDLGSETVEQPTADLTFLRPEPDPTVSDAEGIRATVEGSKGRLAACYERTIKVDPTIQGRVEMELYISAGRAQSVQVFANTTGDAELGACLTTAFRRMRFPRSAEGEVLYPLVFAPRN